MSIAAFAQQFATDDEPADEPEDDPLTPEEEEILLILYPLPAPTSQ